MKDVRFLLFVLLVLAVASFIIGRFVVRDRQELIKTDTVTVVKSIPVEIVKRITLKGKTDTLLVKDSVHGDSFTLPVVQRVYTDDSTYRAYVSGVRVGEYPKMDSIAVRQRLIERMITNTIERKQHWRFGVGVNAGVSIITGKPDMTAGFFAGYTF